MRKRRKSPTNKSNIVTYIDIQTFPRLRCVFDGEFRSVTFHGIYSGNDETTMLTLRDAASRAASLPDILYIFSTLGWESGASPNKIIDDKRRRK